MDRILDKVASPADLKALTVDELQQLAGEIRSEILAVVSRNGGHLASSLGVVELTLALHYVFDSPTDAIIWDVSHQSYAHKIVTGRRDRFHTIRTGGGLSGFTSRAESPHDPFGAGHASTSISAALGIAEGKRIAGLPGKVVAVIGDGSLTGGLAFEGLNAAGHLEKDLIVILNDNEMSISPNVGALSAWFSRKFTTDFYKYYRKRIKEFLANLPRGGNDAIFMIRRAIDSSKALLTPGILFEGFNFQYIGPINGHSIRDMIEVLREVRDLEGPVVVHVRTVKGRGYGPAEEDPARFHGIGSFDLKTGKPGRSGRSYTHAFGDAIVELAGRNPSVIAITAAMSDGTGLNEFQRLYPSRLYDVGIAEEHAVTFAAGLATQGIVPVVAVYSTFMQRAYDQIIHDVALQNLHVVFALDRAGIVGQDGPTHNGAFDMSYARIVPGATIMAPSCEDELRSMFTCAVQSPGPVFVRYPRGPIPKRPAGRAFEAVVRGKGVVEVKTAGAPHVLVCALGSTVEPSVKAVAILAEKGVRAAVINARFAKPLDEELILSMADGVRAVVTVEENTVVGGFGEAVFDALEQAGRLPARAKKLGLPDEFIAHGDRDRILKELGLDAHGIARAAEKLLS